MQEKQHAWLIPVVLIMATSAGILSTDLYIPGMPDLARYFETDAATVQLTMSLNLAGYGLAQLIYGPLSDRIGRRPVLLIGIFGFLVTSLGCALAWSIESLIVMRLLQGVTASVEAVMVVAIIRDLYAGSEGVRIFGIYGMAVAVTPAIAPILGGYIHVWLGWRANFAVLTGFVALVFLLVWRFIPETLAAPDRSLRFREVLNGYLRLLSHLRFLGYVSSSACVCGGLFGFITAGPFVLIDHLGVATHHYGYYQAVSVLAYFLGSLLATRGAERIGTEGLLQLGLMVSAFGGLALPMVVALGLTSPYTVTACTAVFVFGLGPHFATVPLRALDVAPSSRGAAASMLGLFQFGGGGIGAACVSALHDGSAWPMAIVLSSAGVLGIVVYYLAALARRSEINS